MDATEIDRSGPFTILGAPSMAPLARIGIGLFIAGEGGAFVEVVRHRPFEWSQSPTREALLEAQIDPTNVEFWKMLEQQLLQDAYTETVAAFSMKPGDNLAFDASLFLRVRRGAVAMYEITTMGDAPRLERTPKKTDAQRPKTYICLPEGKTGEFELAGKRIAIAGAHMRLSVDGKKARTKWGGYISVKSGPTWICTREEVGETIDFEGAEVAPSGIVKPDAYDIDGEQ